MTTRAIAVSTVLLLAACGDNSHAPDPGANADSAPAEPDAASLAITCDEGTLEATLGELPGVSSAGETDCGDYVVQPARCFAITMDQPIDHAQPDGASFPQHLFLVHRGCDRPTLVADWGYSNDVFFDIELSLLYGTNDLWIEHRFQGASVPVATDWDWSALTIENGARDTHQVIDAFRMLYQGRWVSTGASKGGITATYHSYFFPDDLDGAIPYVAPASRARIDPAYQDFLDESLPAGCADRVRDVQVAALTTRRAMMLDRLTPYTGPGGESEGLEMLTNGLDWGFWQAWGASYCNQVPRESATDGRFWKFYLDFSYLAFAAPATGDEQKSLGALYYEWLTEQGFALQVNARVAPLLEEPAARKTMEDDFREMFPTVALPAYDGSVTAAVRDWMRDEAEDVLLIYGQYDPWSGGAMDAPLQPSSARFTVPAATHGGAQIGALGEEDQAAALAIATRFFGTAPDLEQRQAAARAGAVHRRLLERRESRALATPLRMRLRALPR
jgi:hypothetical protein